MNMFNGQITKEVYDLQYQALLTMLENDTDKNKPKKILNKNTGRFTKKFLDWNKEQIKGKRTFLDLSQQIFDPLTGRFSNKKYDRRFKPIKLDKKTEEKKPVISVAFGVIQNETIQDYKTELRAKINNLIELNDNEEYIEVDFKKIKLSDFLDLLLNEFMNINHRFVSNTIIDPERYISYSQNNLQRLTRELTQLTYMEDGSDMEYLFNTIQNNGNIRLKILFKREEEPNQPITTPTIAGSFFKWYNNTIIDLKRYDIYNENDELDYKNNCLYIALHNFGIDISSLNTYKMIVKNGFVPISKLNFICEKLKIEIHIKRAINGRERVEKYGKSDKIIKIGLIQEHYFLIEKTQYTSYSIKNYDDIKELKDFNKIDKKTNGKYKKSNTRFIDSYDLIKLLMNQKNEDGEYKYFSKISYEKLIETPYYKSEMVNDELIEVEEDQLQINEMVSTDNTDFHTVFFDFETITKGFHKPYLMCCLDIKGNKRSFVGKKNDNIDKDCAYDFINYLKSLHKRHKKILLVAHNLKYDFSFIYKYLSCINIILNGNRLMGGGGRLYYFIKQEEHETDEEFKIRKKKSFIEIKIQDSLNLISSPLKKFGEMFNLKQEKEIMPYNIYTDENVNQKWIKPEKITELNTEDYKQFMINCKKWNVIKTVNNETRINIIEYSRLYCEIDCEVLKNGYLTFKKWVSEIKTISNSDCNLNIMNYCSVPSLVNDYMILNGVYKDSYKIGGVVRGFIQKCVVGGRVMCARNEINKVCEDVADYDGVSLYPSAMNELGGILNGKPKLLKKEQLNKKFLNSVDGYFVKVLCKNNPTIKLDFPLLSSKNDDGIRNFTNDTQNKIYYLDKTMLEDAENFQGLKFDILCGYYYNEGRNHLLKETINILFNERLKKKEEGNPIQQVYKLFMNSAYGKSLLKPIDTDTDIIHKSKFDDYMNKHYNFVKEYCLLGDNYFIKKIRTIDDHFNNCYFGVEVLSISKRIMNRVMTTAEEENIKIYYTDTDSLHIQYHKVKQLEKRFKEKYKKVLNGKQLGQFHIDFDLEENGKKALSDSIISKKSIYLGKKSYIDYLEGETKEGEKLKGYHIRMKGTPNQSIMYECRERNINPFEFYDLLYNKDDENKKHIINIDMLCGGERINFKYNKLDVYSLSYKNKYGTQTDFNKEEYQKGNIKSEFTRTLNFHK